MITARDIAEAAREPTTLAARYDLVPDAVAEFLLLPVFRGVVPYEEALAFEAGVRIGVIAAKRDAWRIGS